MDEKPDAIATVDEHALVDPAVCAALGVTVAEIMAMGLRDFFDLASRKGYDIKVQTKWATRDKGRLALYMASPRLAQTS